MSRTAIHQWLCFALAVWLMTMPDFAQATSLSGTVASPESTASSPKDQTVKQFVAECHGKQRKGQDCDKLRKDAVEILKEDILTLGSSANREFLPTLVKVFNSDEPELRIAVFDAIGMIGPRDSDTRLLGRMANDPIPDVRNAASQAIRHGKGQRLSLLAERLMIGRVSRMPDAAPDTTKFALPVAPNSSYLFYASDAASGRLSYVAKNKVEDFFKAKGKREPMALREFQKTYRYQLDDEQEARRTFQNRSAEARNKRMEELGKDVTNPKAIEQLMQLQGEMASQALAEVGDHYDPKFYGSPTVVVLEERQIGSRSYPVKYVVLYQEIALGQPGYRFAWMTTPDDLIKTAQTSSLKDQQREEAAKKQRDAFEESTKKKDEQHKKTFKKGQDDLEKELGF
jgi:HEAT repeats